MLLIYVPEFILQVPTLLTAALEKFIFLLRKVKRSFGNLRFHWVPKQFRSTFLRKHTSNFSISKTD